MPKLVTTSTVLARINMDTFPDIEAMIGTVLDGVTSDLETVLRTKFALGNITDKWFVDESYVRGGVYFVDLYCTQGFVNSLSTLVYASTRAGLASGAADLSEYAEVVGDGRSGVISVRDINISGKYVKATYAAGFDVGTDGVYDGVPAWLEELAILRAIQKIDATHPTLRVKEGENVVTPEEAGRQVSQLLDGRIRYEPAAVMPQGL